MVFGNWIVVASIDGMRHPWWGVVFCCAISDMKTLVFVFVSVLGHMVDALASGADEGRGRLRYASGSCQPSVDPRISEWGNPARVMSCYSHLNI